MGSCPSYELLKAAERSNLEDMKKWLAKGARPNCNEYDGGIIIDQIIRNCRNNKNFPAILDLLLKNGGKIGWKISLKLDEDDFNVLELIDVFIRHKIDFNYKDITSYTNEEIVAIFSGNVVKPTYEDMSKLLKNSKTFITAKNLVVNGKFPLSKVASWYNPNTKIPTFLDVFNDVENLTIILHDTFRGVRTNYKSVWNKIQELKLEYKHDYDFFEKTCMDIEDSDAIQFLIDIGYDPNKNHTLLKTVKKDNIISTEVLLKNGAFVHYRDISGKNAIEIAACNNNAKMVSLLLKHGAMNDLCTNEQLVSHIRDGNLFETKRCLALGANINCKIESKNVLEYAIESKNSEMVAYISGVLSGEIEVERNVERNVGNTSEKEEEGVISKIIPSAPL